MQGENRLHKSDRDSERLRMVMAVSGVGVWDRNLITDEIYFNENWAAILGYEPNEIDPTSDFFRETLHPEDRDRVLRALQKHLDGETLEYAARFRQRTKDGQWKFIKSSGKIVEYCDDGRPKRILGTHTDITEQVVREQALIRSERLAAVGTLSGGVAHEFNNINTGVLGFVGIALERKELTPDVRKILERVRDSALRAKDLTANLLDFAGKRSMGARDADLGEVVVKTIELVEQQFDHEGTVLDVAIAPVPRLKFDPTQIGQVILNLLINARHALIDSPLKRIWVRMGVEESTVWVTVRDSGSGIKPELLSQIFSPFFSTKGEFAKDSQSKVKGTGLGLSVSTTIAENHGGSLNVENHPNGGAEFKLVLPLNSAAALRGRALIVHDSEAVSALIAHALKKSEYEVVACSDPSQPCLDDSGVTALVLDLESELYDSHELACDIASREGCGDLQLYLLSYLNERDVRDLFFGFENVTIVKKPLSLSGLLDVFGSHSAEEPHSAATIFK